MLTFVFWASQKADFQVKAKVSALLGIIILGSRIGRYRVSKAGRKMHYKVSHGCGWLLLHPMGPLEEMHDLSQDLICQLLSPSG